MTPPGLVVALGWPSQPVLSGTPHLTVQQVNKALKSLLIFVTLVNHDILKCL